MNEVKRTERGWAGHFICSDRCNFRRNTLKEIKLLKETHRQSIDILVEQIEELHKANEWHYVKGGDLPPEDTKVLALMAGDEVCSAHFYRRNVWDKIGTVIAWKEIILPKGIKEND